MPNNSLEKLEKETIILMKCELNNHLIVTERIFNFIGTLISTVSAKSVYETKPSTKVLISLMIKTSNDLRCINLLSLMGYPTQSLTITSSIYESAFIIAYIGNNDDKALKWIENDNPKKVENLYDIVKIVLANLGVQEEKEVKEEYKIYRQLCMAKHSNSLYQKQQGFVLEEKTILAYNGPDKSQECIRSLWFALEHAIKYSLEAINSFISSHLAQEMKNNAIEEYNIIFKMYLELNNMACEKWGTEDPCPGKW